MKLETAKEYLGQILARGKQIRNKQAQVDHLADLIASITPTLSEAGAAHGSGVQDKMAEELAAYIDKKAELEQEIAHLLKLTVEAYDLLNRLENPQYVDVLHRRYFLRQSFGKIADALGYGYRNVCYIHGKALVAFGEVLDEERKAENEKE